MIYVVVSNVDFTAIVNAGSKKEAEAAAGAISYRNNGDIPDFLEAVRADEYFKKYECTEIEFKY